MNLTLWYGIGLCFGFLFVINSIGLPFEKFKTKSVELLKCLTLGLGFLALFGTDSHASESMFDRVLNRNSIFIYSRPNQIPAHSQVVYYLNLGDYTGFGESAKGKMSDFIPSLGKEISFFLRSRTINAQTQEEIQAFFDNLNLEDPNDELEFLRIVRSVSNAPEEYSLESVSGFDEEKLEKFEKLIRNKDWDLKAEKIDNQIQVQIAILEPSDKFKNLTVFNRLETIQSEHKRVLLGKGATFATASLNALHDLFAESNQVKWTSFNQFMERVEDRQAALSVALAEMCHQERPGSQDSQIHEVLKKFIGQNAGRYETCGNNAVHDVILDVAKAYIRNRATADSPQREFKNDFEKLPKKPQTY